MTSTYQQWYRYHRELMIENFGGKCSICGNDHDFEFHHIKKTNISGNGRGSYKRIMDVKLHYDCYILLCHNCHLKLHDNIIDGD